MTRKVGKHRLPGATGKDKDNGIRFEGRVNKRLKRRAIEKAGRKANRRKKK